jgi:hypothetical protein
MRPRVHAAVKIPQPRVEVRLLVLRCHSIHARRSVPLWRGETVLEQRVGTIPRPNDSESRAGATPLASPAVSLNRTGAPPDTLPVTCRFPTPIAQSSRSKSYKRTC